MSETGTSATRAVGSSCRVTSGDAAAPCCDELVSLPTNRGSEVTVDVAWLPRLRNAPGGGVPPIAGKATVFRRIAGQFDRLNGEPQALVGSSGCRAGDRRRSHTDAARAIAATTGVARWMSSARR